MSVVDNQQVWKSKAVSDFGDIFRLYRIFTTSTGLELPTDLSNKFEKEPQDWHAYYTTKREMINASEHDVLINQANKEYKDAQKYLKTFKDDVNYSLLIQVACKMLWILDALPEYAGCYYILSYMLFIVNRMEDALDILDMGRTINPTFEPFSELEKEILLITQAGNKVEEVPVLINDSLSPEILKVLLEIFHTFDQDCDDCLSPEELDFFVFSTNGQHPPTSFIEQMGQRFGANELGWLTKKGFLAFYLEQTLGDPSETRKDIRAHGYDGSQLKKKL
ncbi:hypothetical protein HPULCUR_008676 [Helicostylum pulchrum]|uniref:EF-hand domain-containing protein n=1 Tax=Helicostylum pulchrum TaxID=562976 RepID=A0ABP9Y8W4_9FUNG